MSTSSEHAFAVVESVEADGLRLKFDGEDAAGEKTYKCNTFFKFAAGDRVYCVKDSGTFVAICKIGAPAQSIDADTAEKAETAETAESVDEAKAAGRLTDSTDDTYYMLVRKSQSSGVLEYARSYDGQYFINQEWFPLGCPIDESVTYPGSSAIVRFRSTSDGKLQFMLPYRDKYSWHTVTTE